MITFFCGVILGHKQLIIHARVFHYDDADDDDVVGSCVFIEQSIDV